MQIDNPNLLNVDENGNLIAQTKIQKYSVSAFGLGSQISVFLTSDGLEKNENNVFTFNSIRSAVVYVHSSESVAQSILVYGWTYNRLTGQLLCTLSVQVDPSAALELTVLGD